MGVTVSADIIKRLAVLVCTAIVVISSVVLPVESAELEKAIKLSGPQDGLYAKAEYLVDLLLVVEKGKTLTFAPGSIIRLDKYGEIRVYGTLICRGTDTENIVFMGHGKDGKGNPLPFGWNGIVLEDSSAAVVLENTRISNSTFGLKIAARRASAKLRDVWFSDNGTASVSIGDSTLDVQQNSAFALAWPLEVPQQVAGIKPTSSEPFSTTRYLQQQEPAGTRWRTPARISLGALTVVGAGMLIAGQVISYQAQIEYDALIGRSAELKNVTDRRDAFIVVRNIGIPCLILGALNFTLTFVF